MELDLPLGGGCPSRRRRGARWERRTPRPAPRTARGGGGEP